MVKLVNLGTDIHSSQLTNLALPLGLNTPARFVAALVEAYTSTDHITSRNGPRRCLFHSVGRPSTRHCPALITTASYDYKADIDGYIVSFTVMSPTHGAIRWLRKWSLLTALNFRIRENFVVCPTRGLASPQGHRLLWIGAICVD